MAENSMAPIPIERGHQAFKALKARHRQIMRLQATGMTNIKIAQIMNMTPQAITIITGSDVYKREMAIYQAGLDEKAGNQLIDVRAKIEELAQTAIKELESILQDRSANQSKLRADVAFDLLDRGGYRAPAQVEHKHAHLHGFVEDLKTAHEIRKLRQIEASEGSVQIEERVEISSEDVQTLEITDENSVEKEKDPA